MGIGVRFLPVLGVLVLMWVFPLFVIGVELSGSAARAVSPYGVEADLIDLSLIMTMLHFIAN